MDDLRILTGKVCVVARTAGRFLKEERKSFRREAVEEKHAHDYVSYVDKESEKRIVAALGALLPEAGFIVEEGSAVYRDEPYCWVVDPLDGTTNYIHGNAPYCVSIALRNKHELLLGVVYDPCLDECFYAWKVVGVQIADRIVTFSKNSLPLSGKIDMKVDGNTSMKFVITDLIPGTWQIKKDGKVYIPAMEVRSDDGILSFEGTAGHYEFLR